MTIPHTHAPHTSPARRTQAVLVATALVAVGALAGCSSNKVTSTTTTTTPAPSVTAPPLPKEATFVGASAGAAADVKIVDCPTAAGTQTVKVDLTNSTKKARDYAIMVIWLKNDSGTPLGSTMIPQRGVAPGKKVSLTGKAKVVAQADHCVLNVKAGKLK